MFLVVCNYNICQGGSTLSIKIFIGTQCDLTVNLCSGIFASPVPGKQVVLDLVVFNLHET